MAIDANNCVWEVRPTNGSDNNGGFFVTGASGTDYSQQNSPQFALTGIATSGAGAVFLYASATAAMVGNGLNVISGTNFTTGRFQITSVSVGVSVTVDRNICTGVGASGVINIGGAIQNYSTLAAITITTMRAYIKAEATITITARPDFQNLTNLELIGYTTTRTDLGKATITTSNGTDNLLLFRGTGSFILQNFTMTDTSGTRHNAIAFVNNFNFLIVINCSFSGNSISINWNGVTILNALIRQCAIASCTGAGISIQIAGFVEVDDCYIHDNTGNGIDILATASPIRLVVNRSVIRANAIGIKSVDDGAVGNNSVIVCLNCAIISNTSDGIKHLGTGTNFQVLTYLQNCIVYGNGGYGVNVVAASLSLNYSGYAGYNAYGSNTSGNKNNFPAQTGDVALSADPFTNAAGGDFSLNATAGGGAACKAVGFPLTFP